MAVYKAGWVYWYEFLFKGERVRESTHQGNQNTARTMESAISGLPAFFIMWWLPWIRTTVKPNLRRAFTTCFPLGVGYVAKPSAF